MGSPAPLRLSRLGRLGRPGRLWRRIGTAVAALAVVWAVAGCGDDDSPDSAAEADSASDDAAPADAASGDDSADADTAEEPPSTSTTTTTTTTTTTLPIPVPEAGTVVGLLALDRPLVIGHAGGDRSWPHSTMYGFAEAARAGVDVLEMDLQLTGDGVLVVHHDHTVDRTSDSQGRLLDMTLAEVQALDNAHWWSENWPSHDEPDDAYVYRGIRTGERPPPAGYTPDDFRVETFRSVAERFAGHVLDVEIKVPALPEGGDDLETALRAAQILADEIAELDRADSTIVVSFNGEVMKAFRTAAPDVATSPATSEMLDWFLAGAAFAASDVVVQVPPDYDGIDVLAPEIVERVITDGLDFWVWPNDSDAQENADFYESVLDKGAHGIIAGRPEEAVERFASLSG